MLMGGITALIAGTPARAATWTVDGASPACSNAASSGGTPAVPFCTIQAAASRTVPGDTVLVAPAVYREQVTPRSGSPGLPITYRATAPGVLLLGTNDLSNPAGWMLSSPTTWSQPFSVAPKQVFVDGARLATSTGLGAMTPGSFFYDAVPKVLHVDLGGPNPAAGHVVEASARTYGFNLVSITDVVIEGFAMRGQNSMGVRALNTGSVTLRGIETSYAAANGFRLEAGIGPVTVEGSVVSYAGSVGILVIHTEGVALRGNTSHHNGFHGISLQGSNNNLLAGNIAYANVKPSLRSAVGIDINLGSSNNVIRGNTVFANDDSGMEIYTGSNNNLVTRNVSYLNGDHGFDLIRSEGTRFIGNTSYGNYRDGFSIEGNATNTKVFNNIAVNNGVASDEYDLYVDAFSLTGFESDYNVIWNSSPQGSVKFNTVTYPTLLEYRAATGHDWHGTAADPMFVSPESADFRLAPGSPAIDAADATVSGFTPSDHDGVPPSDDPTVPDTGSGSPAYADRGAFESDPRPIVSLSLTPRDGRIDVSGTVTADASGSIDTGGTPIASFLFDFGDGTVVGPQADAIAAHAFPSGGVYTLAVTVADAAGGGTTVSRQITVTDDPPLPLLHVSPLSGLVDLTVTADGSGSLDLDITPVADYTFDFGDGTIVGPQSSPVASHTYTAAGNYTIVMTVADTARNAATATSEVQVRNDPPVAALTVSPGAGTVNLDVVADASASTDVDGSQIVTYRFDFGDGKIVQQTGPVAAHTYTRGGTFVVTMTAIDAEGLSASASAPVSVTDYPPSAELTVTPPSGRINLTVIADASGSRDDDGSPIMSYTFDFGDGAVIGPQAGPIALHVYKTPGNYTVSVIVTDTSRLTSAATASVSAVNEPPVVSLSVTPSTGFVGMTATADASGSRDEDAAPIRSYAFDFGDGTIVAPVTGAAMSHVYRSGGVFTVRVTVTDTLGLSSVETAQVHIVDGPPVAALQVTPGSGPTGMAVTADASASRDDDGTPIQSYRFEFGDGFVTAPQASPSATHVYTIPGTFSVRVTVTDTGGHSTSATAAVVMVDDPPVARLTLPAQIPIGATITASAGSSTDTDATPIASYRFDFGDGTPAVGPQSAMIATHTYARAGTFTVVVTVTDTAGLSSTASKQVLVALNTAPAAVMTVSPNGAKAPVVVTANASGSTDTNPWPIASYTFNFGDGTPVVGPQASPIATHTFTRNGNYQVMVTVRDTAGASGQATVKVSVKK